LASFGFPSPFGFPSALPFDSPVSCTLNFIHHSHFVVK
jgi:hypothetical protein